MSESQKIVSVLFFYDAEDTYARPVSMRWCGREYRLAPVQFWHTTHRNNKLVHHYTVSDIDNEYTFTLALETDNLTWQLERVEPKQSRQGMAPRFYALGSTA